MNSQNPYFLLFPINNARTGFKPFAISTIYIERHRTTIDGLGLGDSETLSLRYYVVNAPGPAKVAGPFNTNLRIPDGALFEVNLTAGERSRYMINLNSGYTFYNSAGEQIEKEDAAEGDFFEYSLSSNNVTSRILYYPDAYYYDFSTIAIDVEDLPRPKRYLFVWEATFRNRVLTGTGGFKCIGSESTISQLPLEVAHPGEVHEQMLRGTPSFVFQYENFRYQNDPTLEFYRPLADALQDIFDEQELLDGINFIDSIPAEFIPYLAYLIGWDLPNYPGASDSLRRTILRNAVRLQKIKGTKRVILELFDIFGFTVNLINLWANKEGTKLLGPDDGLEVKRHCQVDLIASNYEASGFGLGIVPLTFKPTRESNVILYAWLVKDGPTRDALLENNSELSSDLNALNDSVCNKDTDGLITPVKLLNSIPDGDATVIGRSVLVVGEEVSSSGQPILNSRNVTYDQYTNTLNLNFDHEMSVHNGAYIFIYAVYERDETIIPSELSNTRSNKFDVEIVDRATNEAPDFDLLKFLLVFLFKLKAFHSLLRKIKVTVKIAEVYNVSDFCLLGVDEFAPGSDLGDLHTPPAIAIVQEDKCEQSGSQFKDSDIKLRNEILSGLEEEFQAWKSLGSNCEFTDKGQDKVLASPNVDLDHNNDQRETYCEPISSKPNYCYKGRVDGRLSLDLLINNLEIVQNNPCSPKLGMGFYWETKPDSVSSANQKISKLGNKIRRRQPGALLHFTNESYYKSLMANSGYSVALDPISLNIEKDNLTFPGHRFVSLNKLEYDCVTVYNKRPWDFESPCGFDDNELNARIIESVCTIENELGIPCEDLVYDTDVPLVYSGNGLEQDIKSLNVPIDPEVIVTHKLLQHTSEPHPSLTDDFEITNDSIISVGGTAPLEPLFQSACSGVDYSSGYPAKYGLTTIEKSYSFLSGDTDSSLDLAAIAEGIGLPNQADQSESYFFLGSMIKLDRDDAAFQYYRPYRLDCGCLTAECGDTTSAVSVPCNTNAFIDNDGDLDTDPDKLSIDVAAVLVSTLNLCGLKLDAQLKSLFCINESCSIPTDGEFRFRDTYGIIYEVAWVYSESVLDISLTTKDPKIPCQEPSGYKDEQGNIFRRGIISTWRKILKITSSGYNLEAESQIEQKIDFYKDNVSCNEEKFVDPFVQHLDCAVSDKVDILISGGPAWTDPSYSDVSTGFGFAALGDCSGTSTYWWDVASCGEGTIDQPFGLYWIDPSSTPTFDPCDNGDSACGSSESTSNSSASSISGESASSQSTQTSSTSSTSSDSSNSSATTQTTSSTSNSTNSTGSSETSSFSTQSTASSQTSSTSSAGDAETESSLSTNSSQTSITTETSVSSATSESSDSTSTSTSTSNTSVTSGSSPTSGSSDSSPTSDSSVSSPSSVTSNTSPTSGTSDTSISSDSSNTSASTQTSDTSNSSESTQSTLSTQSVGPSQSSISTQSSNSTDSSQSTDTSISSQSTDSSQSTSSSSSQSTDSSQTSISNSTLSSQTSESSVTSLSSQSSQTSESSQSSQTTSSSSTQTTDSSASSNSTESTLSSASTQTTSSSSTQTTDSSASSNSTESSSSDSSVSSISSDSTEILSASTSSSTSSDSTSSTELSRSSLSTLSTVSDESLSSSTFSSLSISDSSDSTLSDSSVLNTSLSSVSESSESTPGHQNFMFYDPQVDLGAYNYYEYSNGNVAMSRDGNYVVTLPFAFTDTGYLYFYLRAQTYDPPYVFNEGDLITIKYGSESVIYEFTEDTGTYSGPNIPVLIDSGGFFNTVSQFYNRIYQDLFAASSLNSVETVEMIVFNNDSGFEIIARLKIGDNAFGPVTSMNPEPDDFQSYVTTVGTIGKQYFNIYRRISGNTWDDPIRLILEPYGDEDLVPTILGYDIDATGLRFVVFVACFSMSNSGPSSIPERCIVYKRSGSNSWSVEQEIIGLSNSELFNQQQVFSRYVVITPESDYIAFGFYRFIDSALERRVDIYSRSGVVWNNVGNVEHPSGNGNQAAIGGGRLIIPGNGDVTGLNDPLRVYDIPTLVLRQILFLSDDFGSYGVRISNDGKRAAYLTNTNSSSKIRIRLFKSLTNRSNFGIYSLINTDFDSTAILFGVNNDITYLSIHHPDYGIRLYSGDKLTNHVDIGYTCGNIFPYNDTAMALINDTADIIVANVPPTESDPGSSSSSEEFGVSGIHYLASYSKNGSGEWSGYYGNYAIGCNI